MSFYPADGDIYYGWKSFGRSFSLVGVVALTVAALAFCAQLFSRSLAPADALFLSILGWVGGGIFVLMLLCGLGSLIVSHQERGSVEVTPAGVRRIFNPKGSEEFFPREEIAGMYARPEGGMALFDESYARQMIIPRSIVDYRACVEELKSLGIAVIVPPSQQIGQPYRPQNRRQRILNLTILFFASFSSNTFFGHHEPELLRHACGIFLLAVVLYWIRSELSSKPKGRRTGAGIFFGMLFLILFAALLWRW